MVLTAVCGDVHACQPAFDQVLADIVKKEAKRVVCLGDIVGYGPHPGECIEAAKDLVEGGHHVLAGNHDLYFLRGEFQPHVDDFARKSTEWAWQKYFGVKHPRELFEATRVFEKKIKRGVKIVEESEPIKWYQWVLFPWALARLGKRYLMRRDFVTARNAIQVYKHTPKENRAATVEYWSLEEKKEKAEEYFTLLGSLERELSIPKEGLMFSHAFPRSLSEYAEQLEIGRNYIERLEVYVVLRDQWEALRQRKRVEYESDPEVKDVEAALKDLKARFAVAEDLVELLADNTTLFLGHNHEMFVCDSKKGNNSRIIIPGSVFKPRDPNGNQARYLLYDDENPSAVTLVNIQYDRQGVNKEMEEAGLAEYFNR